METRNELSKLSFDISRMAIAVIIFATLTGMGFAPGTLFLIGGGIVVAGIVVGVLLHKKDRDDKEKKDKDDKKQ